ncbi:hypothetical protein Hanom_Chr12g01069581 [Helianthus anomalus]
MPKKLSGNKIIRLPNRVVWLFFPIIKLSFFLVSLTLRLALLLAHMFQSRCCIFQPLFGIGMLLFLLHRM